MAKKLTAAEAAAQPKKLPDREKVLSVAGSIDRYRQSLDDATTAHATEWKRVEALQLDKQAFKLALKLRGMEPTKRDAYLGDLEFLIDVFGLKAQGNLFDGLDEKPEAEGAGQGAAPTGDRKLDDRATASAYNDGLKAGKAGKKAAENPHDGKPNAKDLADAWADGWTDGQTELVGSGLGKAAGRGKAAAVGADAAPAGTA